MHSKNKYVTINIVKTQTKIKIKIKNMRENTDILLELEHTLWTDSQESFFPDETNALLKPNTYENQDKYYHIEFIYHVIPEKNIQVSPDITKNKMSSSLYFIGKYMLTSSLIFGILLVGTNYSAYYNVVKSYIFKQQAQQQAKWLISSVEASNIKEKYKKEINKEKSEDTIAQEALTIRGIKKQQDKQDIKLNIEITPYENRVIIPKIWKNIPLLDVKDQVVKDSKELNDIFMKELSDGIVRYPSSAKPWEEGNSFIFGHSSNFPWMEWNYNDVFSTLDNVVFDDEIIVYYGQEKYKYKIREKTVIKPGDVSILKRDKGKKEITLMTCWPIGTTLNRLIVIGELVE